MYKLKKGLFTLLIVLAGSLALVSCDDDHDRFADRISQFPWEVDLGYDMHGEKLISVFKFFYDGTGLECIETFDGELIGEFRFRWQLGYRRYGDFIGIRYIDVPRDSNNEYFDEIEIRGDEMYALHYLNRYDFEDQIEPYEVTFLELY